MAEAGDGTEGQFKKFHPFFSGPSSVPSKIENAVTPPTPDPSCSPASDESRNDPVYHEDHQCDPSERKRKRRKTVPSSGASETTQSTGSRPKRRVRVSAGPGIVTHFGQEISKGNQSGAEQALHSERQSAPLTCDINPIPTQASSCAAEAECDTLKEKENSEALGSTTSQKPQKLLKFNPATGTIGSPPRSKPSTPTSNSTSGKRRGRKRKSLVITVSYGIEAASREQIGQRINGVLSGAWRIPLPTLTKQTHNTPSVGHENDHVKALPKKPSHPFFQAKAKAASSTHEDGQKAAKTSKPSKRQVIFTSTPCSPGRARPMPSSSSVPSLNFKKGTVKVPGAQHPAWPWREVVHIRGKTSSDLVDGAEPRVVPRDSRGRKAKGQAINISEHENILYESAARLTVRQFADELKSTDDENFRPIAPLLRVPIKHFESGRKLQAQVAKELCTLHNGGGLAPTHPAIIHAYNSIATTLSAFDKATCESVAWAQKYAPTSAQCVLQTGREAELLRDWLQSLKVQAVDTGTSDNIPKSKNASAPKKKRGHKKLEGFVVSSDEESNDLDELSEDEPQNLVHGIKKTVVRSGDGVDRGGKPSGRLANTVLLSGPHGCGKTATVYAMAKELDFEVFEINAGARRSGKDILERVGDMTRNHLVRHHQKDEHLPDAILEDEVAKDTKSGKQGMMTSFFKPQHPQPTKKVDQTHEAPVPVSQENKPSRSQKQSLILLEEVDILYEEDKQFWATVIAMIAQSKRPFIMTCNNESSIPLQSLKLHGIFRLSSPPMDLAVDMLLLIAANEGHVLRRDAVKALYGSRGYDLRAAITELNYWCQIGVGDLRGGFDWFYPRWPKGSDIDEEGQTIRVVSQDTYHTGMGWLNRDLTASESSLPSVVPNLHREAWEHWGLDVSDHHEVEDAACWARGAMDQASSRATRLALLQSIETFTDIISESDLYGTFLPPLSNHIALDATMPQLHAKTLDDFPIGNKVLEVTPLCHYTSISQDLSASLRILAQSKLVDGKLLPQHENPSSRLDEGQITGDIEHHLRMISQAEKPITRKDYSIAFDPIAVSEKILSNNYLDPSVFDREMTPLCLDVAPYVRSIVSYDLRLYNERRTRSNLLSEGGRPEKKRMRTTRAALSALEGGSRATTRRERYFAADINPYLVMRTGGKGWEELVQQFTEIEHHAPIVAPETLDTDIIAGVDQS
ncbi:hypothetical protein F5B22DRAFT_614251 [Xylaria bambusicola]|uniref:uncharacterized protein n=1 Tax=Xylaria bambusicola TaxID=326684 RepID=UPI00200816C9|nr:uncharacterized protein F5B22DRAFT_614251 [Xylaria bambusicola]KAI0512800.1 hypothetical protein F5B22DRAFT_614251 [Xylaria bambusicola]